MVIGILALQGAYDLHRAMLPDVDVRLVKTENDLVGLDGIILPGGESTVMKKLLVTSGVEKPLRAELDAGMPVFGTCAGLILLANHFSVLDCVVERNSYGTQINSFEADIECVPLHTKCRASFIRAPKIISMGNNVEVLARYEDEVVGVMTGNALGIACHPEVLQSSDFHEFFVAKIRERVKSHT